MDYTNINDPAGVKALLDQLRASQAWQELSTAPTSPDASASENDTTSKIEHVSLPVADEVRLVEATPEESRGGEEPSNVSNHISSLLSRLQTHRNEGDVTEYTPFNATTHPPFEEYHLSSPVSSPVGSACNASHESSRPHNLGLKTSLARVKSTRSLTFNESLPVIGRLADESHFLVKLEKIREEQSQLEKKLWEERCHIVQSQVKKVEVAKAKAAILRTEISQADAKALENSFAKELEKFDSERALSAWDALIASQQSTLEGLGVPNMFVTTVKSERERQQRIIQVLDGFGGPEDDDDMES
ncbi:hypothetical protein BU17DRAFT_80481 [Hysterangium stoloniferum]|nr:hypothetical protein BU17DRAFT_80481 [Hysterangium stoloniferum]